jgi:hypothetical protein
MMVAVANCAMRSIACSLFVAEAIALHFGPMCMVVGAQLHDLASVWCPLQHWAWRVTIIDR